MIRSIDRQAPHLFEKRASLRCDRQDRAVLESKITSTDRAACDLIATMNRPFLGVESSATGKVWRDRLDERASVRALVIVQRHGLPELLARVLAGRGVAVEDAVAYLDPTVRALKTEVYFVSFKGAYS